MSLVELSVVIPTLNECVNIAGAIASARQGDDVEIIVADGGSADDTVRRAQQMGATVVSSPPGRGRQLNAGAACSQGRSLLFLHADTRLPPDFAAVVHRTLQEPGCAAGAFTLRIDAPDRALRWIERLVSWRSRMLQLPYGDQAIFLTAETFRGVGGFPELPIMEDVALVRRLRRHGRIVTAPEAVVTSARRWRRHGVLRTTLRNQACLLAYHLGVSPQRIACWYGRPPSAPCRSGG